MIMTDILGVDTLVVFFFFFFQAEDGIRDYKVTGVQTCALPISMIAKLIVHGDTREQALARLDAALAETRIVGLATNVQFLRLVIASDAFATAKLDTALIEREKQHLFHQQRLPQAQAVAAAVAQVLQAEDRKSTRLNSSHLVISYAVFC